MRRTLWWKCGGVVVLVVAAGCASWRPAATGMGGPLPGGPDRIRVVMMVTGDTLLLYEPVLVADTLHGWLGEDDARVPTTIALIDTRVILVKKPDYVPSMMAGVPIGAATIVGGLYLLVSLSQS